MSETVTYYAIVGPGELPDKPAGIVRRRVFEDGGFTDEALHRDNSWRFTPVIVEWKHGDFGDDLIEIDKEQANRIVIARTSGGKGESDEQVRGE
jgi:hypothetical protein